MFVEIFSICDAATDSGGRLNLLGTFEGIAAPTAPIARDRCSIAARIRFDLTEKGSHSLEVRIVDKEGKSVGPTMGAKIEVKTRAGWASSAHNLVLNINRLLFPNFGTYEIRLLIDGKEMSRLPLLVAQIQKRNRLRSTMEN